MALEFRRLAVAAVAVMAVAWAGLAARNVFIYYGVAIQPLPLGAVQWFDEVGVTVDRVDRVSQIGSRANALHAKGQYYIVHARVIAPFGFRPDWHDSDVEVRTFAGTGGTMHDVRFGIDKPAQALLDRQTGRPGPNHVVLGAEQHENLVFDLPRNVEQPAIVFLPANAPEGLLLSIIIPHFWQPHRFNLRYD